MVNTKKFSEFAAANLTTTTKKMAGISNTGGGENIIVDFTVTWTTSTRPAPPYDGLLGYNTDLKQYEYWDDGTSTWVQLADNAVFTDAKFIVQQPSAALPAAQALSLLTTGILKSTTTTGVISISAPLTSIDGLTTAANKMIYTTAPDVYAVTDLTAFARTLLDDSSAAAMRSTLGLGQAAVKNVTDNSKANVASVTGSFVVGHVLLAADTSGTVVDGGSPAGMGTVLEVDTGTGLTGGPITTTGTISFASIAANSLWVNNTGAPAVPTETALAALTKVDDTNVTMTLGGTPATALINAVSLTLGWTGQLSGARGGTGVDNGSSTATYAGNLNFAGAFTTSGAFAVTQTYTGVTNVTFPTSGTLATTSQLPTLPLSATDGGTGVSNPTAHGIMVAEGASPMTPITLSSGQILIGSTGVDPVAGAIGSGTGILVGNGAGSITVSLAAIADHTLLANISGGAAAPTSTTLTALIDNAIGSTQGDLLYRNATVWTVLAPGSAGQLLRTGGAAANPSWTTATFPSTGGAAGNVLISDGTNYIASTSLWPNTVGASGKIVRSNGTSNAYSTATYPDTATSTGTILRADGTNWVPSTATYPNTAGTANNVLASDGTNFVSSTLTAIIDAALGSTQGNILYRNATVWTVLAPSTSGFVLTTGGAAANPAWAAAPGGTPAALTKADDTNVTLTLTGTPSTALLQAVQIAAGWSGQLALTRGGTAASLTASNGGIVYSNASALAILAGTSTAGLALLSGSSTTPSWSTLPPITKINVQTVTATGAFTYTPTTGTKYSIIELQGGGGGSGGSTGGASQGACSAGGGGGAYQKLLVSGAANLAAITGSVGVGGTAGTSGNNAGGNGGDTTLVINSGSTWTSGGGLGGPGSAANAAAVLSGNQSGGTNTSGTNGTSIFGCNGGYSAPGFISAAAAAPYIPSLGGSSFLSNQVRDDTGMNYGNGGSGLANPTGGNLAGKAGGQGIVIITEFISV